MISQRASIGRIAVVLTVLFAGGCTGQNGAIPGASDAMPAHASNAAERARAGSLLFVSDSEGDPVSVYTFPKGAPVRELTGAFSEPQGECTDGKNVYVANTAESNVLEFAADGWTTKRTIDDSGYSPGSCSYDPTNGNLAVGNILSTTDGPGSIAIYRNAKGKARLVTSTETNEIVSVQYDGSGNLFITGLDAEYHAFFGELAAGSKHIKILCSPSETPPFPASLGWDGKFIVMSGTQGSQSGVFRMQGCKQVGFTPLGGGGSFYIDGKRIVVVSAGAAAVLVYDYPKGGSPISTITGFLQPIGVVVAKP
jgi:hypothetical protein